MSRWNWFEHLELARLLAEDRQIQEHHLNFGPCHRLISRLHPKLVEVGAMAEYCNPL